MSKPKLTKVDIEAAIAGGIGGTVCGIAADSVHFSDDVATIIAVSMAIAFYSIWYGIRAK